MKYPDKQIPIPEEFTRIIIDTFERDALIQRGYTYDLSKLDEYERIAAIQLIYADNMVRYENAKNN